MRHVRFQVWIAGLLMLAACCGRAGAAAPATAAAALLPDAREARILVLAELHGTHEAPALAGTVVQRRLDAGTPVTLALEIDTAEQPRIDAFLETAAHADARAALLRGAFWQVPPARSDGRRSVAMLALVAQMQRLRSAGHDIRVLAFDAGNAGGGATRRNERMAAVLRDAFTHDAERAFVVLVGNYHARRASLAHAGGLMPGQAPPVPTMAHLADIPMFRVKLLARSGEFWGCADGRCGPRSAGGSVAMGVVDAGVPALRRTPEDAGGFDAQLSLPRFSVASPAVSSAMRP